MDYVAAAFNGNTEHSVPAPVVKSTFDDLQKVTVRNLWERFRKSNESHSRPALRFTFSRTTDDQDSADGTDFSGDDRWTSKLGGYAWWPADEAKYPYDRSEDDKSGFGNLYLLAQFNLAEIPSREMREALGLPSEGGILQFFVAGSDTYGLFGPGSGHQGPTSYRVKFWPQTVVDNTEHLLDTNKFAQIPSSQQSTFQVTTSDDGGAVVVSIAPREQQPQDLVAFPFDNYRPLKITFAADLTRECWGFNDFNTQEKFAEFIRQEAPDIVNHLCQPDPQKDAWKMCYALNLIQEDAGFIDPAGGSKLGGHPTFTQDDPRRCWSSDEGTLLFQLDSDGPVCIGDCGVMNFFNAPHWTRRGEFDGAKYNWDCG